MAWCSTWYPAPVPIRWADRRVEWLRFTAPIGATSLRVPTEVPFTAIVDGRPIPPDEDVIALDKPLAAGTVVYLPGSTRPAGTAAAACSAARSRPGR